MSFKIKRKLNSFYRAGVGIKRMWQDEPNWKFEIVVALIVIGLMIYFQVSLQHAAILILTITVVLILEMINTALERLADIVKPRIVDYVATMKNISAAAVLVASIGAVVVGILIFWSYIF